MNLIPPRNPTEIVYPDSDGEPMSDNTRQAWWILWIFMNLDWLFKSRDDIFVASNLLWYPVEGFPEIRGAPDVLVSVNRPRGYRGSYKQWEEGDQPPTVVFEILSPGNTATGMREKFDFYEEYGVEEYYVYDPETNQLEVYARQGGMLVSVRKPHDYVSPRLGIRFDLSGPELVIHRPDGEPFRGLDELAAHRQEALLRAEQERQLREQAEQRAEQERQLREQAEQRAEQERQLREQAEQRGEQERQLKEQERQLRELAEQRAKQERQRSARLMELSRKARQGTASAEELAELDLLESGGPTPP